MAETLSPITFKIQTPDVDCAAHVARALALGLTEADTNRRALSLVANGPSARRLPTQALYADTMAVNGALGLFTNIPPTYWIACDPQEVVASFLERMPRTTTYLVASKCHPAVFERLRGRMVRLWHVGDCEVGDRHTVPVACSVTLCALMLAMRMGYRAIDVWGWDLCFDGDEHHAAPSPLPTTPDRKSIQIGDDGPTFESNPTWACELEDAAKILPVLKWAGMEIRIHGRSMLSAVLPEYAAHD